MVEEVLGNAFIEHVTFDGACIIICVRSQGAYVPP